MSYKNPHILAVETAVPEFQISQAEATQRLLQWLEGKTIPIAPAKVAGVYQHAGVEKRYSVSPVEQCFEQTDFGQKSEVYSRKSLPLARQVCERLFRTARLRASEVDLLITVSCTGFMIPALDAYLFNELEFRRDVRRLPIAQLGCSGGASALCRAVDFLRAYPSAKAMVLAVELSTLNFQPEDLSGAQIISTSLFGDGAAAVALAGSDALGSEDCVSPRVVDYTTAFFPKTLHFMGYRNSAAGMHIVLSPEIPDFVNHHVKEHTENFLRQHGLHLTDISRWILHPGGRGILEAYQKSLSISREAIAASYNTLRDYGNLSSATILYVLRETMMRTPHSGEWGVLMAFGPGFSADMMLFRW